MGKEKRKSEVLRERVQRVGTARNERLERKPQVRKAEVKKIE